MKRHQALVPLSHDHHQGLVQARRLRRAAEDPEPSGHRRAATEFVAFFTGEGAAHFRDEEELLLPLLADRPDPAASLLAEIAADHAAIRALVRELLRSLDLDTVEAGLLGRLGERLERHVRLEERILFPLIEKLAADEDLDGLMFPPRTLDPVADDGPVVNLTGGTGNGPLWGTASEDLNATLLAWDAEKPTPEQTNDERDVLLVGIEGTAEVSLGGISHPFGAGRAVLVEKGTSFYVTPGLPGVRYLSVHLRRPGLQIASRAGAGG
jgi:hemerythrin-like domain-containing protein